MGFKPWQNTPGAYRRTLDYRVHVKSRHTRHKDPKKGRLDKFVV